MTRCHGALFIEPGRDCSRGLLKVEQLHALARAVYYGQRGRISAREVYDQMNASIAQHRSDADTATV